MTTLIFTILAAALLLGLMCLGLTIGVLLGRRPRSRCACGESKRVAKLIEDRKKAAKKAKNYSPEKVDPNNLPIVENSMR